LLEPATVAVFDLGPGGATALAPQPVTAATDSAHAKAPASFPLEGIHQG
jgi:hypothetical protein